MAQIGVDCELILDGTGYFVKPGSYHMKQPRVRKATVRADNGLSYVDLGPGKRVWTMVLLCKNELLRYDSQPTGITGQQCHMVSVYIILYKNFKPCYKRRVFYNATHLHAPCYA